MLESYVSAKVRDAVLRKSPQNLQVNMFLMLNQISAVGSLRRRGSSGRRTASLTLAHRAVIGEESLHPAPSTPG